MQSTEEYLDRLLASVSEDDTEKKEENNDDIFSLLAQDETEAAGADDVTEEEVSEVSVQQQLAELLGLEIEQNPEDMQTEEPSPHVDVKEDTDVNILESLLSDASANENADEDIQEAFLSDESVGENADINILEELLTNESVAPSDSGVLSADEIEALFAAANADNGSDEEADLDSLLSEENTIVEIPDSEVDEEMLMDLENVEALLAEAAQKAEETTADSGEELVEADIMSMLAQYEQESMLESQMTADESAKVAQEAVNAVLSDDEQNAPALEEEKSDKSKRKKEKKKREKKQKSKQQAEENADASDAAPKTKKKSSLKEKITAFMFDDDEEKEEKIVIQEGEEIELTSEEASPKAKKEKKKKEKKKKGSAAKELDENAAIEAELAEEDKKKAKKKEKPPKEKKSKKLVIAEKNNEQEKDEKGSGRHSIGIKGIVATLLVCASVLGLILVGTYVIPRYLSLQTARVAFYMQNYEETAMRLRGRKLSDSDRIMFEKASLIYGLQERYHQYEIYHQRGMVKEALNQLLQGVAACEKESILAQQLGIEAEWQTQRDLFVNALQTEYGLDSATVDIVSALRNPDYTVAVQNILSGRPYNDKSSYGGEVDLDIIPEEEPEVPAEDKLEDLLPEEEAILEQLQQENEQVSETVEPQSESAQEGKELYSGTVNGGSVNFVN